MRTYFNTPTIYAQSQSKVNKEAGIISNIIVVQKGEAKGHNVHLNNDFLDNVVRLAGEFGAGVKARFGHPNICATALGTYLGRYKNYHRVADQVLADLHLDKSAMKSPNGDLYSYVLEMAENNPDMFGASIAFKHGEPVMFRENINGKEVKKNFATIQALYATDLVDSPAATDGLFEMFHEEDYASQVTNFLEDHPQIFELLDNKPEIIEEFLTNYKHFKSKQNMNLSEEITKLKDWITDNFSKLPEGLSEEQKTIFDTMKSEFETKLSALPDSEKQLSDLNDEIKTLKDERTTVTESNSELEAKFNTLQTSFDEMETELNQLKATKTGKTLDADPNVNLNKDKETEGKSFLKQIPQGMRKRIFNKK